MFRLKSTHSFELGAARGFLRNYARYLGLDAVVLLARFDSAATGPAVELAPLSNANAVMPTGAKARAIRLPEYNLRRAMSAGLRALPPKLRAPETVCSQTV